MDGRPGRGRRRRRTRPWWPPAGWDLQPPPVLLDIAFGDGEPESGAIGPGGKNGSQTDGRTCLRYPGAGVGNLDGHLSTGARSGQRARDPKPATGRHGVERVGDQLYQNLLHLHGIDPHVGQGARNLDLQLYSTLPQLFGERGQKPLYQPGDAFARRPERRRPGKAQQVADPPVEPVHFLDDGVEVFAGRRSLRVVPHHLGGGAEAGERVPQAVGHGRGHLADRCELLRLNQLRLGPLQL